MQNLIPPDHDFVVFRHDLLQALIEVGLQVLVVFHAVRVNEGLDLRILIPMLSVYLVSANVEVGVGKKLGHLPDEFVEEFIGLLSVGISDRVRYIRIDLERTGTCGEVGTSDKPRAAVARGIELRQHPDATIAGVREQVANLILAVIQAIGTHLMQPGELLALDPKTLVVGKMQMQNIHLHCGHSIQIALKNAQWNEVPANINQQSAPGKPWLILYRDCRHSKSVHARFDQLQEGLQSVKNAQ